MYGIGSDGNHQMGIGTGNNYLIPQAIDFFNGRVVTQIACGSTYSFLLTGVNPSLRDVAIVVVIVCVESLKDKMVIQVPISLSLSLSQPLSLALSLATLYLSLSLFLSLLTPPEHFY